MVANVQLASIVENVTQGRAVGHVEDLCFRDPEAFRPGELHRHAEYWVTVMKGSSSIQSDVLRWVHEKVSVFELVRQYNGSYKGQSYDCARPPQRIPRNNKSCKSFVEFVRQTLLDGLRTGAISLLGNVGEVDPPRIVHPLTVEPRKPRLCYDARYLNLWMQDKPITLDKLCDVPRYVAKASYQTMLDDKSGYLMLTDDSRTFFGFQ
jgi:hypothetical protein